MKLRYTEFELSFDVKNIEFQHLCNLYTENVFVRISMKKYTTELFENSRYCTSSLTKYNKKCNPLCVDPTFIILKIIKSSLRYILL